MEGILFPQIYSLNEPDSLEDQRESWKGIVSEASRD